MAPPERKSMPRGEVVETPLDDTTVSFHVMYKYRSQKGDDWYEATDIMRGLPTLTKALELAARLRNGQPPSPKGATDIHRTQIYQRIWASHVLLEEGDD